MAGADVIRTDLFEHAPCGLLEVSMTGEIVGSNHTFLSWVGYAAEDLVGRRRFSELMTIPGRIFYETHFAPLLRMQGFVEEIAVDLIRKEGATLPVFISANERRDASGAPTGIRVAVFRASDRRRYERELLVARRMAEQALEAKSRFLGVFAHEVRNPLTAVKLAADGVARAGVNPEAERGLEVLQRSLDRVLALLANMLEFSKFEAGKEALDVHRFDVRELVHGVVQTLEPLAERRRLPVHVEVAPRVPEALLGDAVKIGQVLTNLAGNAVKFTHEGAVTIGVDADDPRGEVVDVRFQVRDTGIGIPADRLQRIFDEFEQATPEIGQRYGGTGLGLAISRRIVELHGSKLRVESAPGAGTTFSFDLPLRVPPAGTLG